MLLLSSAKIDQRMGLSIWYVSKYVAPPGGGTAGGRGYLLMKELAEAGHKVAIITSDSNQLATPPRLEVDYLFQELDGMQLCWVRTMKYVLAKSLRRILSWLHFEWRLLWLPSQSVTSPVWLFCPNAPRTSSWKCASGRAGRGRPDASGWVLAADSPYRAPFFSHASTAAALG